MKKGKIVVAGIGPGGEDEMTATVVGVLRQAQVVVGYHYYFRFIEHLLPAETVCVDTGMKREEERAAEAFRFAEEGKTVVVISSGDSGIYGMAALIFEMKDRMGSQLMIEVLPGISAFQKAAALLGAPIGHDLCLISLSDLLTPWDKIEKRILAAASADFVTAVYNPRSEGRYWQLHRLKELFLRERDGQTPVGFVRQAGREEQEVHTTTLADFEPEQTDMFTLVLIGNSQSWLSGSHIITPRGYKLRNKLPQPADKASIGQEIMKQSFRAIEQELKDPHVHCDKKWLLLHAIHTTADFDMEHLLYADAEAVSTLHRRLSHGQTRVIITDVTMVASGIRKKALERMGIEVKCYLNDERSAQMAAEKGITRTQAGIRLATAAHPDGLFVFGNAPTALMELCDLIRKGKAAPAGIIAAPVGFVHVEESKHRVKTFAAIPKLIIEGRKGGSALAATLVNAILTFDEAGQQTPGQYV